MEASTRGAFLDDRYEVVKDLGSGNFGVTRLVRDKQTNSLLAAKFLERGDKIDHNVEREILIHRTMSHPNIVKFKAVTLTASDLVILMEYASGGELFQHIQRRGRIPEVEARYFFQQLICGVAYCHQKGVCHRDLKLENALLTNEGGAPFVKICDFGYSKSNLLHSQPNSTVGTPAYIAPEVLTPNSQYDGQIADVWSCGVLLYVMLVGSYPFEDPNDPRNLRKSIQRTMTCAYSFPSKVEISNECKHLLSKIFVLSDRRISIPGIMAHPWFKVNLPTELLTQSTEQDGGPPVRGEPHGADGNGGARGGGDGGVQDEEAVKRIIKEAMAEPQFFSLDDDDMDDLERMNEQYGTGSGDFKQFTPMG